MFAGSLGSLLPLAIGIAISPIPIIACILMLIVFFGVTIAGGRAHDRQNRENVLKARRIADEAATKVAGKALDHDGDTRP